MLYRQNNRPQVLNLTDQNTAHALEASKLCESIRIRIERIGKAGVFQIPVRKVRHPRPKIEVAQLTDDEINTIVRSLFITL